MKKHFNRHYAALVCLFFFASTAMMGCKKDDVQPPTATADQLYANSISDAMLADSSEIVDSLWAITASDTHLQWKTINGQQYVLMGTFMRYPDSYPQGDSINTVWGEAWLFIPGQMKARLASAFTTGSDTTMRVCQLLGLPPVNSRSNTHIAEMWVPAQRLYRPAGNPDVTTATTGAALIGAVTADYTTWFNNYIVFAYYHPLQSATDFHYPWTRLGYTYDWSPMARKVGLSEYVLPPASGCWVEKVRTVSAYFKD